MSSPNTLMERIDHRLVRTLPGRRVDFVPQRPIVTFTFDDAPISALTNGARVLETYDVRGTFYVSGSIAGQMHDGQLMIDAQECRMLARRGHEIAHHGYAHLTPALLGRTFSSDVEANDVFLAGVLDEPARNFAFPYGRSSLGARRRVGRRFRSSRGVQMGMNRLATDLDLLSAVKIEADASVEAMTGWIDDAVRNPGWLIYFTHDVQDDPTWYGARTAVLEATVAHAVAAGCEVLTIDAALDRLGVAR